MNRYDDDIPDYPIQNQLTNAIRKASAQNGDTKWTHLWSGQSPRLARAVSASTLMQQIIRHTETLI